MAEDDGRFKFLFRHVSRITVVFSLAIKLIILARFHRFLKRLEILLLTNWMTFGIATLSYVPYMIFSKIQSLK
jgi:hypothetical protein